uniref:Uncharacterized protein n=1 Tax=Babesia bovis TaxID=5865 RepID=A7AQJ9_BABBO|eukprot:XP_001610386.1 hypothetical protein [Babesia bovis T2Bo]
MSQGLFYIAIQQFLLGISLYSVIHYLHPSLTQLAWLLFGTNAISAVLGFMGALKRNIVMECVYLVFYAISLFLIFLTVLDMAELVHLLPRGPQLKDVSDFASIRSAALPSTALMRSNAFLRQRELPYAFDQNDSLELGDSFPALVSDDNKTLEDSISTASTDAEDNIPSKNLRMPQTEEMPINQHVGNDLNMPGNGAMPISGNIDAVTGNLEPASKAIQQTTPNVNESMKIPNEMPMPYGNSKEAKSAELPIAIPEQTVAKNTYDAKTETFYDRLPLVPHIGETEGEAEEVSKDELPPETHDLTPEGVSEVVAIYKIQKRPLKMAAAGLLTIALLFNIYCYWVAVTFVLNKCTCLDELVSHPEQFTPLID